MSNDQNAIKYAKHNKVRIKAGIKNFPELASKYKVDRNAPLPTGEPVENINDEAYYDKGIKEVCLKYC
jgi:hypothetical protein